MDDFFSLYDALIDQVSSDEIITATAVGDYWSLVSTDHSTGIAMTTPGDSIPPVFQNGIQGLSLKQAAPAVKSWNLNEASLGMAAINAYYNTGEKMDRLRSYEPFEKYSTDGIDFADKTVGIIGHMRGPAGLHEAAREVYILERSPQEGDYPDSACDWILPRCDIVLITGSSLINKTLPHLLELCRDSITILTGPSVPMCPALFDFGIDRIAGLVVDDHAGMLSRTRNSISGSPYCVGRPFLLCR